MNRARWLVAIVASVAVLAFGTTALWWRTTTHDGGPLLLGDNWTSTGMRANVGDTTTFGTAVMYNSAGVPIKILSIELVRVTGTASVEAVKIVDVERDPEPVGAASTYAPPTSAVPANGAILHPGPGQGAAFHVLFGVRIKEGA